MKNLSIPKKFSLIFRVCLFIFLVFLYAVIFFFVNSSLAIAAFFGALNSEFIPSNLIEACLLLLPIGFAVNWLKIIDIGKYHFVLPLFLIGLAVVINTAVMLLLR